MLFSGFRVIVNIDLVVGVTLSLFIVGVFDGLAPAQIRHLKQACKLGFCGKNTRSLCAQKSADTAQKSRVMLTQEKRAKCDTLYYFSRVRWWCTVKLNALTLSSLLHLWYLIFKLITGNQVQSSISTISIGKTKR